MAVHWEDRARRWAQWACLASATGIIASILFWPVLTRASNPAQLCEIAAQNAARRHDVPLDVLRAVALVETGQTRNGHLEPWPWAVNTGGPGHWPGSRSAALDLVRARLDQGQRNVDLGCFQINYRWHGQNFASLDDMIDPEGNADYAARLLSAHKARLGSWDAAAGAYHSGTAALAERYIARFRALRGQTPASGPDLPRENRFSLLQPGGAPLMSSLVPQQTARVQRPLIPLGSFTQ